MTIKTRIKKLELKQNIRAMSQLPGVVEQREGESIEQAIARTYDGLRAPDPLSCIVVPAKLTTEEWEARYSPKGTPN